MDDVKMTALAANALGWFDYPSDSIEQGTIWHTDRNTAPFDKCFCKLSWNPLEDDGEALQLAVALNISVNHPAPFGYSRYASFNGATFEANNINPGAAVRRAIVKAAAAIGTTTLKKVM